MPAVARTFISATSASTPSSGMALYTDARMPPTERCPFSCIRPRLSHAFRNSFSSSGVDMVKGMFITLRTAGATGHV
jgi:hypothetical protein